MSKLNHDQGAMASHVQPYHASVWKIMGARVIRALIATAVTLIKPASDDKSPEPVAKIRVPRSKQTLHADDTQGRDQARSTVHCDVYLPKYLHATPKEGESSASARSARTKLPVILNMHGSGFILFAMGDDAPFCQQMADEVDAVVVDIDYSKGPEYPYPNASNDIDDVLAWVKKSSATPGTADAKDADESLASIVSRQSKGKQSVQGDCIALTGFSAGANLALTTGVRAYKEGRLQDIRAVAAFYPSTNLAEPPSQKPAVKPEKGAAGGVLPPAVRRFFYSCYVPFDSEHFPSRDSDLISPLYAAPESFPSSTTIITCSGDSLAREGRQLMERIMHHRKGGSSETDKDKTSLADPPSGVPDVPRAPVQLGVEEQDLLWWQAEGQGHAWDKLTKKGTEPDKLARQAYALVSKRLQAALRPDAR